MNPWFMLGSVLALVAALGGAYLQGRADGKDQCTAELVRDARVAQIASATLQPARSPASGSRTPRSSKRCNVRLSRLFATASASILMASCATSMPPSPATDQRPLLRVSCPPLTPLAGPTFGETTTKLIEIAGQYRECQAACLKE